MPKTLVAVIIFDRFYNLQEWVRTWSQCQTQDCELIVIHNYERNGKDFIKSTTELNTLEFEQYVERCRFFMQQELGINTPLPNEVTEQDWITFQNTFNY